MTQKILKNCNTMEDLESYLNQKTEIVTINGGRRFIFNGDNVSEKAIIKQFERVVNTKKPSKQAVKKLMERIEDLSNEANIQLETSKKSSLIVKLKTLFKQGFGNLGYNKKEHKNKILEMVKSTESSKKMVRSSPSSSQSTTQKETKQELDREGIEMPSPLTTEELERYLFGNGDSVENLHQQVYTGIQQDNFSAEDLSEEQKPTYQDVWKSKAKEIESEFLKNKDPVKFMNLMNKLSQGTSGRDIAKLIDDAGIRGELKYELKKILIRMNLMTYDESAFRGHNNNKRRADNSSTYSNYTIGHRLNSPDLKQKYQGLQVFGYHDRMFDPGDKRYVVRDETYQAISSVTCANREEQFQKWRSMGLKDIQKMMPGLDDFLKRVVLYHSKYSDNTDLEGKVLGRFDVLEVPATFDYDFKWQKFNAKASNSPLKIHHAAALNIGENLGATDFSDYSINGQGKILDTGLYLADMKKIFLNVLKAQIKSGVTDAVWFPFGMGAFLRKLKECDPSYIPEKLDALRYEIAEIFFDAYVELKEPKLTIHLCLPNIDPESKANHDAFIKALHNHSQLIPKVRLYINGDATYVAQCLANQGNEVSLTNAANRSRIGNHWFNDGARIAIDENVHRRSVLAARIAAVLSPVRLPSGKVDSDKSDLFIRVKELNGKVKDI